MIPKVKVFTFTGVTPSGTPVSGTIQAPTKFLAKLNVFHSIGVLREVKIGGVVRKPTPEQKNHMFTVKAK